MTAFERTGFPAGAPPWYGVPRVVRFAVAGGACAAVQLLLLKSFLAAGQQPLAANVTAFTLAAQLNFVLSRWSTWGDRPLEGPLAGRWARFMAAVSSTAVVNLGVFAVASGLVPPVLAAALGIATAAAANFLLGDRAVFAPAIARR